jgi:hypothetical protein
MQNKRSNERIEGYPPPFEKSVSYEPIPDPADQGDGRHAQQEDKGIGPRLLAFVPGTLPCQI